MNAVCSECAQPFAPEEIIRHRNVAICAGCKPLFLQKLREGALVDRGPRYAGFAIRFAAKFVDVLILISIDLFLRAVADGVAAPGSDALTALLFVLMLLAIQFLVAVSYSTIFVGWLGATPGKIACGLRVVAPGRDRVTYLRAFARHFAELISYISIGIGYAMVAFDDECRSLHDRICDTRVVYT